MKITGFGLVLAVATSLVAGWPATATPVDFDFSITYQNSRIDGRLVGLDLDANGNAAEADPTSVLLFSVPASAMLPASPSQPYVFAPVTYGRSNAQGGEMISTTPGVYGFHVSNYTIDPLAQNLLLADANPVAQSEIILVFNYGFSISLPAPATDGIVAGELAPWPAADTSVSFTALPVPEPSTGTLTGAGLLCVAAAWRRDRRRRSHHAQ